jgi:DNA repair protein RecO (recombination protein O)
VTQRRDRLYRTEAVVIHRQDMGEADRLLTLYTPTMGKLRVIAKGARRPTSRKAGHLELFIHSTLLIAKGKSLDIVTQAETLHAFRPVRDDLERITYAHYVVELLDRFASEGEENHLAFELLINTLQRLCETGDPQRAILFYEVHLLALEGYQPQLFRCVGCGDVLKPVVNYFDPAQGGMLCPRCGERALSGNARQVRPLSVNALKILRYMQTHDAEACSRLRITPETHRDLENMMLRYITYILERNLKSFEFLKRLRQESH